MSGLPPEKWVEYGCAYVLQEMTKELRPAVRKAYRAEDPDERMRLIRDEAIPAARSVIGTLEALASGKGGP